MLYCALSTHCFIYCILSPQFVVDSVDSLVSEERFGQTMTVSIPPGIWKTMMAPLSSTPLRAGSSDRRLWTSKSWQCECLLHPLVDEPFEMCFFPIRRSSRTCQVGREKKFTTWFMIYDYTSVPKLSKYLGGLRKQIWKIKFIQNRSQKYCLLSMGPLKQLWQPFKCCLCSVTTVKYSFTF